MTANQITKYSTEDCKSIIDYFGKLKPSSSNQKLILEYLEDISSRDDRSIKSILDDDEFGEILNNDKITHSQKCLKFMTNLRSRKFPLCTRAEISFNELRKKLKLPLEIMNGIEDLSHAIKDKKDMDVET